MGGILSIGQTALNAAQVALNTVSHNIANANTPGYTRQETVLATHFATSSGAGYIGQGVRVATVERVYSDFLTRQTQDAQSAASAARVTHQQLARLDTLFGDSGTGLASEMQAFFSAAATVANAPASSASRQAMLSATHAMVGRFGQLQSRLDEMAAGVAGQMRASVDDINAAATEVARLNQAIVLAEGSAGGQPANDLRDQRDLLVSRINEQLGTSVVKQSDGALSLFIGNGQPLVLGGQVARLSLVNDPADPSRFVLGAEFTGTLRQLPAASLSGGTLGALMGFQNGTLDAAQSALGRIALGLAGAVNAQHQLGVDAYGQAGGTLIDFRLPAAVPHAANTGSAALGVTLADPQALVASDYRIAWDGAQFSITRLSDQSVTTAASLPVELDGLAFQLTGGAPAAGDSFLLRPLAQVAGTLAVAFDDPQKIAAAGAVTGNVPATNLGSARIAGVSVNADYPATPIGAGYTLSYNGGLLGGFPAGQPVSVVVNGSTTLYPPGASVPYSDGMTITSGGVEYRLSGTPADGDQFSFGAGGGSGDNRNLLALADLQNARFFGGLASLDDAYGQLVSRIGTQTRSAEVGAAAQTRLLEQAVSERESLSGVNLDEEAAKLLRYQQAYQAAAKVMRIADEIFDTLANLGG